MDFDKEVGKIVNNMKKIEYYLNSIITNFVSPNETGFFDNVLLNSSIMPISAKIKVITNICKIKKKNCDFSKLNRLVSLRNIFAHSDNWIVASDSCLTKLKNLMSYIIHF